MCRLGFSSFYFTYLSDRTALNKVYFNAASYDQLDSRCHSLVVTETQRALDSLRSLGGAQIPDGTGQTDGVRHPCWHGNDGTGVCSYHVNNLLETEA